MLRIASICITTRPCGVISGDASSIHRSRRRHLPMDLREVRQTFHFLWSERIAESWISAVSSDARWENTSSDCHTHSAAWLHITRTRNSMHESHTLIDTHSLNNSFQFYSPNFFAVAFKAPLLISVAVCTAHPHTSISRQNLNRRVLCQTSYANEMRDEKKGEFRVVNVGPVHSVHRQRWRRPTQIKYLCAHMNVKWKREKCGSQKHHRTENRRDRKHS